SLPGVPKTCPRVSHRTAGAVVAAEASVVIVTLELALQARGCPCSWQPRGGLSWRGDVVHLAGGRVDDGPAVLQVIGLRDAVAGRVGRVDQLGAVRGPEPLVAKEARVA